MELIFYLLSYLETSYKLERLRNFRAQSTHVPLQKSDIGRQFKAMFGNFL